MHNGLANDQLLIVLIYVTGGHGCITWKMETKVFVTFVQKRITKRNTVHPA